MSPFSVPFETKGTLISFSVHNLLFTTSFEELLALHWDTRVWYGP